MKLTAVAAVAASAALVSASPLRVIMLTNVEPTPATSAASLTKVHFGHGVPPVNNNNADDSVAHMIGGGGGSHIIGFGGMGMGGAPAATRRPCGGAASRFRQKSIEIANSFRKTFGFPLIGDPHRGQGEGVEGMIKTKLMHGGLIQVMPPPDMKDGQPWWRRPTKVDGNVHIMGGPLPAHPHRPEDGAHHGRPMRHHKSTPDSFLARLQLAIMSLGPWEGRAVAFVIGAGIGVLLRMFWVLAVVGFRSVCGSSRDGEYTAVGGYDAGDESDDDDGEEPRLRGTPISAPPVYVYPIDEKAVVEVVVPGEDRKEPASAPAN